MTIGAAMAGSIGSLLFNYGILIHIIIPDPCYYHSHDTSAAFDLFYVMTAEDGYHPPPSLFNLLFTIISGAVIGSCVYLYFSGKLNKKEVE